MTGWEQLRRWLFLPDYEQPPVAKQLIGNSNDFTIGKERFKD